MTQSIGLESQRSNLSDLGFKSQVCQPSEHGGVWKVIIPWYAHSEQHLTRRAYTLQERGLQSQHQKYTCSASQSLSHLSDGLFNCDVTTSLLTPLQPLPNTTYTISLLPPVPLISFPTSQPPGNTFRTLIKPLKHAAGAQF